MDSATVMTILIDKRTDAVPQVQQVLTEYGCIINTRIGLHEIDRCAEEGLIILYLVGAAEEIANLERELEEIERVKVDSIRLSFDF